MTGLPQLGFDWPWLLLALPLALLPLVAPAGRGVRYSSLALMPQDRASSLLRWLLRGAAVLALAALIVAAAGPYRPEYEIERIGTGAEIVLLLDRSRSMDNAFARAQPKDEPPVRGLGATALESYVRNSQHRAGRSKGEVAREMLAEFAARRTQDRFAMTVFSTLPVPVLDFTSKPEAIQAAIAAGNIGRGLSDTDIGLALQAGLARFEGRPYTGSRIVLLVSDGGDHVGADAQRAIADLARRQRVSIYWIYIRSARSPGLRATPDESKAAMDAVPEYFLNRFFESLGTPYKAYEADNPDALQAAIDDVDRLEDLPIAYRETMPRRDLAPLGYAIALASVLLLLGANLRELHRWAPARPSPEAGPATALRPRPKGAGRS